MERSVFPPGLAVVIDEQKYRAVAVVDYVTKAGQATFVVDWETDCPSCGVVFRIRAGLTLREPRRRCDGCKAPGVRVKTARKQIARLAP